MDSDRKGTFSEHWHRVAGRRVALRSGVRVIRQRFLGRVWHVLHEGGGGTFHRLNEGAYRFVGRLRGDRTIDEVWIECVQADPGGAPGQEEVLTLLAELHQANLITGDLPADSSAFFRRHARRKSAELRSLVAGVLGWRIPLLRPEPLLAATYPFVRFLFGRFGVLLWLGLAGAAVHALAGESDRLLQAGQNLLAPANLPLAFVALVLTKLWHELGHGWACRHFGGTADTAGVMFLVLVPVPYIDVTSSWGFAGKRERMLVAAAGMLFELPLAAVAALVWAHTGEGLIHSLAYNAMIASSVSTLLFNANPLLRFDGYYILADLIEMPNLQARSARMLQFLAHRFLFGVRGLRAPADHPAEWWVLPAYGVAAGVYRVLLTAGIALFVADRYLLLGLVMVCILVATAVVAPVWKGVRHLLFSPLLEPVRGRALGVTGGLVGVAAVLLFAVRFPCSVRATGIVVADGFSEVFTPTGGVLRELPAGVAGEVDAGVVLARLDSVDLQLERRAAEAELGLADAVAARERSLDGLGLAAAEARVRAAARKLQTIVVRQAGLEVTAPAAGQWVAPDLGGRIGGWLPKGERIGALVGHGRHRFLGVIEPRHARHLFAGGIRSASVRLRGQAAVCIAVEQVTVVPGRRERLPSPALGWPLGGTIEVRPDDPDGVLTVEPFFEVRAELTAAAGLCHGRRGVMRIEVPPESLGNRAIRAFRQMLQRRYRL